MKILNVFNDYLERGGEAQAVDVITASLAEIAEVTRCDFSSADWTGANAPPSWKQALWMIANPHSVQKLRTLHNRSAADVWLVHNVFPVGSAGVYTEARRLGVPIVHYIHNYRPFSVNGYLWAADQLATGGLSLNYWEEIKHGAWQNSHVKTAWFACVLWLTHLLGHWRAVKAWVAISEFARQKFIAAGIPSDNVFVLPHFWHPRPDLAWNEGEHYLYLGRLVDAKGILVLLDAWQLVEEELGTAAPRLVIGGDGPLRAIVMARVERLRSASYVGHLSGLAKEDALKNSRALIVPSLVWETLGLVVYEAYDLSRPVLAARSGGLSENVIDGVTGRLHEPGAAPELARHVIDLDRNAPTRRAWGEEGRQWLTRNRRESDWRNSMKSIIAHVLQQGGKSA